MNIESQQSQIVWRYQEAARAVVWMSATPGYQPMHFAYMARAIEQSRGTTIIGDEDTLGYAVTTKWATFLQAEEFALKEGKAAGLKTWRWDAASTMAGGNGNPGRGAAGGPAAPRLRRMSRGCTTVRRYPA